MILEFWNTLWIYFLSRCRTKRHYLTGFCNRRGSSCGLDGEVYGALSPLSDECVLASR